MTLKPAPRAATWILNRFSSGTQDESVMGDLVEQYQRGRGSLWYWRQVLSIVFGELFREFRHPRKDFLVGLLHTWLVWGGMQFAAGIILLARFVLMHPEQLPNGIRVSGFPVLMLQAGTRSPFMEQWGIILLTVILNVVTLLMIGRYCAALGSRIHPRTMLLGFTFTYVLWDAGWMISRLLMFAQLGPGARGALWVIILRDMIVLPLAAALIMVGGRRGLTPASQFKAGKA